VEWGTGRTHEPAGRPDDGTASVFKRSFMDDFARRMLRQIKAFTTSLGQLRDFGIAGRARLLEVA
jgi:hypothetical protein